jgi:hypothetical protein
MALIAIANQIATLIHQTPPFVHFALFLIKYSISLTNDLRSMKNQYRIIAGISTYVIALLIIMHWAFICSLDEFFNLYKQGFNLQTLNSLPFFLKPLYKGVPNLITLICYMLFIFPAFLFVKEKQKAYFYVSISSFVMILWLLSLLV